MVVVVVKSLVRVARRVVSSEGESPAQVVREQGQSGAQTSALVGGQQSGRYPTAIHRMRE